LRQELDARKADLTAAVADAALARDEADQLRQETAQLQKRLDAAVADGEAARRQATEGEAVIQKLRDTHKQLEKSASDARLAMETVVRERDTLAKNVADLAKTRADRDAALSEAANARKELQRVRADASTAAQKNDQELLDARRAENEVKGLLVSLTAEMHEKLTAARSEVANAAVSAKEREELKAQVASLSVDRDTLRASLERALSELKDARATRANDAESQETLDALLKSLHEREQELANAKSKLRDTTLALEATHADLSAAQQAKSVVETERAALKTQLSSSEKAVADQTHVIAAMAEEVANGREQLHAALIERDEARRQLAAKEEALQARAESHREVAGREASLAKLTAERDAIAAEVQAKESALVESRAHTGQLEVELAEARKTAAMLSGECAKLRDQLGAANRTSDQIEARYTALEEEFRQREGELQELVMRESSGREEALAKMAGIERETRAASTRLWNDAARVNERIAELEDQLARAQSDGAIARKKLEEIQAEWDAATEKIAAREREFRQVGSELERHHTAAHTLRLHVEAAEKTAAEARDKMLAAQAERDELATTLAAVNQTIDLNGDEVRTVEMARDAAQLRATEFESQLREVTERLQLLEQEREQSRLELDATRAGLERAKQHIVAVQSRRDEMRAEIARLKVQLGLAPDPIC